MKFILLTTKLHVLIIKIKFQTRNSNNLILSIEIVVYVTGVSAYSIHEKNMTFRLSQFLIDFHLNQSKNHQNQGPLTYILLISSSFVHEWLLSVIIFWERRCCNIYLSSWKYCLLLYADWRSPIHVHVRVVECPDLFSPS